MKGFEDVTTPLTATERECMKVIIAGLKKRVGKETAVSNREMCRKMNDAINLGVLHEIPRNYKLTQIVVRRIIHEIRTTDAVPLLCSNSEGYYIAKNKQEAEDYSKGLSERINSIKTIATAFIRQYNEKYYPTQQKLHYDIT